MSLEVKIEGYPDWVASRFLEFRSSVFEVAGSLGLGKVEESLKWDQPSFRCDGGSPVRFDWSEKRPELFAICFHCGTTLVETFRELYPTRFRFEGNRAIVFARDEELPEEALKHCLSLALRYHREKRPTGDFPLGKS